MGFGFWNDVGANLGQQAGSLLAGQSFGRCGLNHESPARKVAQLKKTMPRRNYTSPARIRQHYREMHGIHLIVTRVSKHAHNLFTILSQHSRDTMLSKQEILLAHIIKQMQFATEGTS